VINQSAAIQDDQHSQAVSAAAMKALAPAWLAAGREAATLWVQVIGALPGVLSHRRPALLTALMNAVPKVREVIRSMQGVDVDLCGNKLKLMCTHFPEP
jgi:hypothetical protein